MGSVFHKLLSKLTRTIVAFQDFRKAGGSTYVNVSQINYGQILNDKSILVTGGGSGIGLAIAKKCLSAGADVIITGRNENKLKVAAEKINNPHLKIMVWDVSELNNLTKKNKRCHGVV